MEPLGLAVLVMAAMVTGALVPVLYQAGATLRSVRRVVDEGGPKLLRTLDQVELTTRRLDAAVGGLEDGLPRLATLLDTANSVVASLAELRSSMKVAAAFGAAVVPALVAGMRAYQAARSNGAHRNGDERTGPEGRDNNEGGEPAQRSEV